MFITFEGADGSGKSTQAKKLVSHLQNQGREVVLTREPGGTQISERIREILLNPEHHMMHFTTELLLYAAARRQHLEELIMPSLKQGKIVICDRFADSTVAYQGFGRQIPLDKIEAVNELAIGEFRPDLTFVLTVPPEIGLERIKKSRGLDIDRMEAEKKDFHYRVAEGFAHLAETEKERVVAIEATGSEEAVFDQILKALVKKELF